MKKATKKPAKKTTKPRVPQWAKDMQQQLADLQRSVAQPAQQIVFAPYWSIVPPVPVYREHRQPWPQLAPWYPPTEIWCGTQEAVPQTITTSTLIS